MPMTARFASRLVAMCSAASSCPRRRISRCLWSLLISPDFRFMTRPSKKVLTPDALSRLWPGQRVHLVSVARALFEPLRQFHVAAAIFRNFLRTSASLKVSARAKAFSARARKSLASRRSLASGIYPATIKTITRNASNVEVYIRFPT